MLREKRAESFGSEHCVAQSNKVSTEDAETLSAIVELAQETDESAKDVVDALDSHVQGSGLRESRSTVVSR